MSSTATLHSQGPTLKPGDPKSFFHRFSEMSAEEAEAFGKWAWREINLPNLRDNIQPTRSRADLVLTKGPSHTVEQVALRKV